MLPTAALFASLALAALLGFAAHRAGLCSVRAVVELIDERRATTLLAFVEAALWSLGLTLALWLAWPGRVRPDALYGFTPGAWLGGALFGVGAALNRGCAFSTLVQLAEGRFAYAAALPGLALGLLLWQIHGMALTPPMTMRTSPALDHAPALLAVLGAFAAWSAVRHARACRAAGGLRRWLAASAWAPALAALVVGLTNGVLYTLHGGWAYTSAIRQAVEHLAAPTAPSPSATVTLLALALFAGMVASSRLRGSLRLQPGTPDAWLRHFGAGLLMGIGAAIAPGGNDDLVLRTLPLLSPHAPAAFIAMLAGIAMALGLERALERTARAP